jgi:hypothetical protein
MTETSYSNPFYHAAAAGDLTHSNKILTLFEEFDKNNLFIAMNQCQSGTR